ncbi:low-density lipoprotein receptor-related protein 4-like [Pecten maximus]|uniref:low-density lipoprotein receptor-related protein 4-like n=1 Tax=Pecten maximus TaxID=6579 RepID=UPI001457EEA6|nr:low-density lipoprotein receptor-related protein 4-like [Pecten maximus]
MDVNAADGSIYFFDITSLCIDRFQSGNIDNVNCGISSSVFTSIAYDWVSGNMYWTDGFFNWIAVQPVDTTDRSMYRVIIQDDIETPRAMALDSQAGYIFWFDTPTSGHRIERAQMDGTSRIPIVTTSLLILEDIETDTVERRLYWTDRWRNSIESSMYDGTDRKIVFKQLNFEFRYIAVDTGHVCATIHDENGWICIVKSTGLVALYRSVEVPSSNPVVITMFKKELQPVLRDSCMTLACEHFCVNIQPSGKCMCKEGYTLDTDGLHCSENHLLYSKAIVVSNATNICMLSFRTVTSHSDPLRCVGNVVQGCQLLTVDTSNKLIYYVDTTSNFIREYNTATDGNRQITTVGTVSGMVFDWTDGNLYWSESTTGKVKYVTIATDFAKELVQVSSPPSHLTIDPHTRTLFWVEGTSGYIMRIVSMSLLSKEQSVIMSHPSPAYIKDIFFDVSSDRVYFVHSDKLLSITRNGSDSHNYYTGLQSVEKFVMYKFFSGGDSFPTVLAMDHSSGILYYAVQGEAGTTSPGSVGVLQPSTGLAKTLVENLNIVYGLVLHPSKGFMFYTDHDKDDSFLNIVRASMNGMSPRVVIALDPDDFLTNLAIDYAADRLYWSSLRGDIESSSLSGTSRTTFNTPFTRIRSIAIAGGSMYITSEKKHKVVKMNLRTETEVTFMADNTELGFLINVFVYPGQVQPVSSVCANNNGGCSTFCLPKSSPSSSYCACQDGTDLKSDDPHTCEGVTRCPLDIPNGKFEDSCTRYPADVCTFQCELGYTRKAASNTVTCGQDGQWNGNAQLFCQLENNPMESPDSHQIMIYIGAGLAGLVIISVTIVAIVCVVARRRQDSQGRSATRSVPNVYYTANHPNQEGIIAVEVVNNSTSDLAAPLPGKILPTSDIRTPAYSVRSDHTYDTINLDDPAPPYEEPIIRHGPSARSDTSTVSVMKEDSDYLTPIHKHN